MIGPVNRLVLLVGLALIGISGRPAVAECLSPEGRVVNLGFLNCVKAGNSYLGDFDGAALALLKGKWDVDCTRKTSPTLLVPEDENNKLLAVKREGATYHVYLHYLPDNAYYAWVVSFLDRDTVVTQYKGQSQGGKITEWVLKGIDARTGLPARKLFRCDRILWCTVTDGTSTAFRDDSGTLQPYFSKGDQWPLVLDLAAGTAGIPYRKDRKGGVASVNEQYSLATSDTLYTLRSTESNFGLINNGLFLVDSIGLEIGRQDGAFNRVLKILDRNTSQGTYQYFTEAGQCRRAEPSVLDPPRQKF